MAPTTVPPGLRGRWRALPLTRQLVGILLVLLLVALTATGYGVQRLITNILVGQIDTSLVQTAQTARDDQGFLNALAGSGRARFPSSFVVQTSTDSGGQQQVVAGYRRSGENLPGFPSVTSQRAEDLTGEAYSVHADDGSRWRATSFPVSVRGQPGAITILQNLNDVEEAVERLRALMLLLGVAVLLASGALGLVAIRRSMAPLRQVEDTAAAIAAGDLSRRIPERPTTTEVGSLTASLNTMLTQIEAAFRDRETSEARTRRFAADASHELRTPLASVRGYAELYRQGAVPPGEVDTVMRRIEDEAKRMGGLVEDLLLLARLDEQRPTRSEPVDLAALAVDAALDAQALDPDREVTVAGLAGPDADPAPAPVLGDEDRLRQVVANLVANAVRHTPGGSPIELAVGTDAAAGTTEAVLEVRDHGPGLAPEHAERVFERFYRVDASRHRGTGGGSGLGLSIVAAVAAAHGGTASVRATPGGGATFVLRLPARH